MHGRYKTQSKAYLKEKGMSSLWQVEQVAKFGDVVYDPVTEKLNVNIRHRDVFILKFPKKVSFLFFSPSLEQLKPLKKYVANCHLLFSSSG